VVVELQYEVAYHLRCGLLLRSGRRITLEALDQRMTYAGLLEGTPCRESNDRTIEYALREAERYCVAGAKPHLISPLRRDYLRTPGDMQAIAARVPHRVPEWLPMVRCIGSFKDVVTARDSTKDLSVLAVLWFQDEYAPPVQEPALSQILNLDWESLAVDVEI
jgi:hypothetical protein